MAVKEIINNSTIGDLVELQSTSKRVKPTEAINQLGQPIWIIKDRSTSVLINLHFRTIDEQYIVWAQKMILHEFSYQDAYNTLSYAHATIQNKLNGIKVLVALLGKQTDEKKLLKNWTLEDVATAIKDTVVTDDTLMSTGTFRNLIGALKSSFKMRYKQDGIDFNIPTNFPAKVMAPILKGFGLTNSQWEAGGSHDMIPMSVATLLLADAIKLIRSEKCLLLQEYFIAFKGKRLTTAIITDSGRMKSIFNSNISDFTEYNPKVRDIASQQRMDFVNKLHEINPELKDFPFKSHKQMKKFIEEIQGACITALLSVSLMRISECESVKADWMESIEYLDTNGEWTVDAILKSKIIKTGGGIVAKRGLSRLGVEVIKLLNTLSWVDKEALGLQLFAPTHESGWMRKTRPRGIQLTLSKGTLRARLQSYYRKFLARSHESVAKDFPHVVCHSFRHLKMAFGLRKFDGAVEAAIKQEMRHNNPHTESYSRNKLNAVEAAIVRRDFVSEVVQRILVNNPEDIWVGPAIKKVMKLAQKLLDGRNIELLSLVEFAELHEKINDNVQSVTFHSYGACVVLNGEIEIAQCSVKDNIVVAGSATSSKCYICTNFCVNNMSHEHNMKINKARWQDTADCEIIASFPIVAEAKRIVKHIERLEDEMEAKR